MLLSSETPQVRHKPINPSIHLDTHIDRPMDGNRHKSSTHELPTLQCIHSQHFWIRFADRLEKKQAFSIHSAGVADHVRRARECVLCATCELDIQASSNVEALTGGV